MTKPPRSEGGTFRRHTRDAECPVCGGYDALPQGKGVRCAGFSLDFVSYCTREECAGSLPLDISTEPPAYVHRLFGPCRCGRAHGFTAPERPTSAPRSQRAPGIPLAARNEIYSAALDLLTVRPEAEHDLTRRGLDCADVEHAGYKSIPRKGNEVERVLRALVERFGEEWLRCCPGFADKNGRTSFWAAIGERDGYVVPYRDENGLITGLQLKVLGGRYFTAGGARTAEMYHVAGPVIPGADIYATEGATKANVAHHLGCITVMGLPGQALAAEHVAVLQRFRPGRVIVALDQEDNPNTDRARERWHRALFAAGLSTYRAVWEGEDVGGPKGIDDLFLSGGRPRLRAVYFVPPETGMKRRVRETSSKGWVELGLSQSQARRVTEDAVLEFISSGRRR